MCDQKSQNHLFRTSLARWSMLGLLVMYGIATARGAEPESTWLNAVSGNWTDAANWSTSPHHPNNGSPALGDTYAVMIDASGNPYTVILNESVTVDSITVNSDDATLELRPGRLETSIIDVPAGRVLLSINEFGAWGSEAVIAGATLRGAGEFVIADRQESSRAVFEGVRLETMVAVPAFQPYHPPSLFVRDGLTIAAGGQLNVLNVATVGFQGSQTIDGAGEILLAGKLHVDDATTLAVSAETTIRTSSGGGAIDSFDIRYATELPQFLNHGTMIVEAGDIFGVFTQQITPYVFENHGLIDARDNAILKMGGKWKNLGTIQLGTGAELELLGEGTTAGLGDLRFNGGKLTINGKLDNTGDVLTANAATGNIEWSGNIVGGRLEAADDATFVIPFTAEFTDITLGTDLGIDGYRVLGIRNNLTLDGATIRMTSSNLDNSSAKILFDERMGNLQSLLGEGTLHFVAGAQNDIGVRHELYIAPGIDLDIDGGVVEIKRLGTNFARVTSEASMSVAVGSSVYVSVNDFVQKGIIDVGGTLSMGERNAPGGIRSTSTWRNEGSIRVRSGGTLQLNGNTTVDGLGEMIFDAGSQMSLTGVLDLEGNDVDLESLPFGDQFKSAGGMLRNGRIYSSGDAVLPPIAMESMVLATDVFGGFGVRNGLVLENATITVPENSSLSFQGEIQRLDGVGQILMPPRPNASGSAEISGSELVIGEGITIRVPEAGLHADFEFKENHGKIFVGANVSAEFGEHGRSWSNHGQIRMSGGTATLIGKFSAADIGDLTNPNGVIQLDGEVQNQGQTILIDASRSNWDFRGQLHGGRLETADNQSIDLAGTMYGVTLAGRLATVPNSSSSNVNVQEHLTLEQGEVVINSGGTFGFRDGASLAGAGTLLLNGSSDDAALVATNIPSGVVVRTGAQGGGRILNGENYGTVAAETAGRTLRLTGAFQNHGTIRSANFSTLEIDIATWSNAGRIEVGPSSRTGGGVAFEGIAFENLESGTITGTGTLRMASAPLVNSGTLAPGNGVGVMAVQGSVEFQPSSRLVIDVIRRQLADQLNVGGTAELGGTLEVHMLDFRQMAVGDTFTILSSSNNLLGQFAHEGNLVRSGYAEFRINYLARSVTLTVMQIPEPPTSLAALFGLAGVLLWWRRDAASAK